jgi:beta-lactamase class A
MKLFITFLYILLFQFSIFSSFAKTNASLTKNINKIIAGKKAAIGVAIIGSDAKDTVLINNDAHYPMQSVFKFHIALVVLSEVDKGNLNLQKKITISKAELIPDTWSPIREKYPNGVTLSIAEILRYTVSESDNIGCDILIKLVGGTKRINDYFKKQRINNVSIVVNEDEMHQTWDAQFKNWTTPLSACQLLKQFHEKKMLSKTSYDFLLSTLLATSTGPKRIKGLLPKGTTVAHKTGTSGTNPKSGIAAATNDIGIVYLPNGEYFYIAVFVSNSKEDESINEKIIAAITKEAWNYFSKKR